ASPAVEGTPERAEGERRRPPRRRQRRPPRRAAAGGKVKECEGAGNDPTQQPAGGAARGRRAGLADRAGRKALAGRRRICDNRAGSSIPDSTAPGAPGADNLILQSGRRAGRRVPFLRGVSLMASGTFSVGDLTAVIGDNAAGGKHRAG